uniref:(northern house mosquito) hypothetical protein n=1 Tax=Culex pipiens TaxID=7175 RepID=A0A8D8KJ54_CULPI
MLIDGMMGRAGMMKRDSDAGGALAVVVEVEVVVAFLDLLTNVPREAEEEEDGAGAAALLLTGATFLASNAGRKGFGDGVRPAKRFLSTTLSTVVLLAVTGSAVVVDRYRLARGVGLVNRLLLPLLLLPLFVSFCW